MRFIKTIREKNNNLFRDLSKQNAGINIFLCKMRAIDDERTFKCKWPNIYSLNSFNRAFSLELLRLPKSRLLFCRMYCASLTGSVSIMTCLYHLNNLIRNSEESLKKVSLLNMENFLRKFVY